MRLPAPSSIRDPSANRDSTCPRAASSTAGASPDDNISGAPLSSRLSNRVRGKDVTPVLLEHFHTASEGVSLDANEELVVNNVSVAAAVAVELFR